MRVSIRWKGVRTQVVHPALPALAAYAFRRYVLKKRLHLAPAPPEGLRLHVGAGQKLLPGYENLDGYGNAQRPEFFQTHVTKIVRAEILDTLYEPESVAEILTSHMFEHLSILDVDRSLRGWNRIMKVGGLLTIIVPDFEGCARKILRLKSEAEKEILYRHIFGSQFGPGEYHRNGFTASRLMGLLRDYGFETRLAYVQWQRRGSRKPDMSYPTDTPLPDLTVRAVKVGLPRREVTESEYTPVLYRRIYPNPELEAPVAERRQG